MSFSGLGDSQNITQAHLAQVGYQLEWIVVDSG